ncbi:MAG: hypothetical protein Q9191_005407 [Dirinaria sp. TL-2023a]
MASTPVSQLLSKQKLAGWVPHFADLASHTPSFDTMTATVHFLQEALGTGCLQSTQLVEEYQRSICLYNEWLGAVYQLAPGAMDRARQLDTLRQDGKILGALHGIPILVKGNIATSEALSMETNAGAVALIGSKSNGAPVIDKLLDAGAIVLGTTTLSELGFHKRKNIRCAWSAAAGQAQSAYVRGGLDWSDSIGGHSVPNPLGSSSGSAIAVSAGLAPIALGTETIGSLVAPATRASLYTIKPTHGLVDPSNIVPITARFDTAGPLGKTAEDIAMLLDILVDHWKTNVPDGSYASAMTTTWSGLKVGTLDPENWQLPGWFVKPVPNATKQILDDTRAAYAKIKSLAKSFHENVPLLPLSAFECDGKNAVEFLMTADLKHNMDNYLGSLRTSKVKSLQELVDWNSAHAEEALTKEYPNQELLEQGLAFANSANSVETREKLVAHAKAVAANFDDMVKKYDIDVLIAPGDCILSEYAAAGGKAPFSSFISLILLSSLFGYISISLAHRLTHGISKISNWDSAHVLSGLQWSTSRLAGDGPAPQGLDSDKSDECMGGDIQSKEGAH